jgi:hypothetical protein
MTMKKYKTGDIVTVIAYTPGLYAPGVKDTLGTERLFKRLVGKNYRVLGFDRGYLELQPTKRDTIWIKAKDVRPFVSKPGHSRPTSRSSGRRPPTGRRR